jgi:hypothetical protein
MMPHDDAPMPQDDASMPHDGNPSRLCAVSRTYSSKYTEIDSKLSFRRLNINEVNASDLKVTCTHNFAIDPRLT